MKIIIIIHPCTLTGVANWTSRSLTITFYQLQTAHAYSNSMLFIVKMPKSMATLVTYDEADQPIILRLTVEHKATISPSLARMRYPTNSWKTQLIIIPGNR